LNKKFVPRLITAVAHTAALLPLAVLILSYASGQLAPNPAQTLEQRTGRIAISLLTATLLVSPLARLLKQPVIMRARRPLGLYTFLYVSIHFLILVGFDYQFNIPLLLASYLDKPFIWFGFLAGLILCALAITSTNAMRKRMGIWWNRLHRLIYLAAVLILAHYLLAVKGGLATLSGNLVRPLVYTIIILIFMAVRIVLFINLKPSP
jgi:sulfoxide reductase heme-binding subunit YedZ